MKATPLLYSVVIAASALTSCSERDDRASFNQANATLFKEEPGPTPEPTPTEKEKIEAKDITKDPTGGDPNADPDKDRPGCKAAGNC